MGKQALYATFCQWAQAGAWESHTLSWRVGSREACLWWASGFMVGGGGRSFMVGEAGW